MSPHAPHFVWSLPPEGASENLGAARRFLVSPHAPHFMWSLPPEGAVGLLEAARRRPL